MRLVRALGVAALVTGLGIAIPAYSQHGREGEHGRSGRQDGHPGKGHEQRGPEKYTIRHSERERSHVQSRPEHRVVWEQYRSRRWENEHRGWRERGGYHGYRVPHERYVVYFGRAHRFRVHTYPVVIVGGHPRFHYHDCWITMVDPWPAYWEANWYETDDVYVEYVHDGYYMYNTRHPGVAIAVNISL
ncbi:MAG: hypothetical protein ROO76_09465 [Terriglobia bacterium]|nr:hypothetical protein [Terriglobia bacterium]